MRPPHGMNAYEFVVVASLRAQQLMQGCVSLIEGDHKATVLAQMEVSSGKIGRAAAPDSQPAPTGDAASAEA